MFELVGERFLFGAEKIVAKRVGDIVNRRIVGFAFYNIVGFAFYNVADPRNESFWWRGVANIGFPRCRKAFIPVGVITSVANAL